MIFLVMIPVVQNTAEVKGNAVMFKYFQIFWTNMATTPCFDTNCKEGKFALAVS